MRIIKYSVLSLLFFSALQSCDKDLEQNNDVYANFNLLWQTIDTKYCFFELKKDSILDWKEARDKYYPMVLKAKTTEEFFYILADMLNELKDGHVNLTSTFDVSRYDVEQGYEDNYVGNILYSDRYLSNDYRIAGGLHYKIIDDIGYIRCSSFNDPASESNIDNVISHLYYTKGIIIDIRDNGGGLITQADKLASHFCDRKRVFGFWQRKTGKGHNDFSSPQELTIKPSDGLNYIDRPIALLTNRGTYSAANRFAQILHTFPYVRLIGDRTGGGSGMPISNELPCGWILRFSSSIQLDQNMACTEWGIDPDIRCRFNNREAYMLGIDSIIETAISWIYANSKG